MSVQVDDVMAGKASWTAFGAGNPGFESRIRRILGLPSLSSQIRAKGPKGLGSVVKERGSLSIVPMRYWNPEVLSPPCLFRRLNGLETPVEEKVINDFEATGYDKGKAEKG